MTAVLLDTHVLLWLLTDDAQLGSEARGTIASADSVYVSAASLWEIEIKRALGKLRAPGDLAEACGSAGLEPLSITWADAQATAATALEHRDPFDKLLLTQARTHGLRLLTADARLIDQPEAVDARR